MAGNSSEPAGGEKECRAMGLTDSEYGGFIRFAFDALKETGEKREKEERTAELAEALENLQAAGEDRQD